MAVVNERGATSVISDLGNNAGIIVGPEIPDWQTVAQHALTVVVTVDGSVVGETSIESITGDPLQALRFLVNHCAAHDIALPAGTLVSSGALTGVHEVRISSVARVDFGACRHIDVVFTPIIGKR
jgi:2-keto-4-pentenoate hydratase